MARQRWTTRISLILVVAAVAIIWLDTSGTLSSFTVAKVGNPTDTARVGALSLTNSRGSCAGTAASTSPVACSSSVYPAKANPSGSALAQTNTISNTGDFAPAKVTAQYRVASCGALALANQMSGTVTGSGGTSNASGTSGAMLPRAGTTFSTTAGPMTTSGFITLDGTATAYAASVGSTAEPTAGSLTGRRYGLGVWFKTTDPGVDPLFGFGSSALAISGTNDRILYLNAGRIGFIAGTGGTSTSLSTGSYNDSAWHFAYVAVNVGFTGAATAVVYVDGAVAVPSASVTLNSYSGYWHAGWSPVAGQSKFFVGSLSGFTVDDSGSAPATSTSKPTSYTSFDTTATQLWQFDDSGGVYTGTTTGGTYTGTVFPSGVDPCTYVDIAWTLTAPAQTVSPSNATLRSMVTAGYVSGTAPTAGTPQTSTITLTRDASAVVYASGLMIYAPIQTKYTVTAATSWTVSFTWSAAAPASTVVIA